MNPEFNRFSTLATMSGYAVIDENGRPLAEREELLTANGVAFNLNKAAAEGPAALAKAVARLR